MLSYLLAIVIITLIYLLLSFGLSLQYGSVGLINFGHVGFFAIGAYTSALLALSGVPLLASFCAAAIAAGLAAWPIGLISLRLRDDYFAIVTLGFSETVRIIIVSEKWLTNGVQGVPGIPRLFSSLPVGFEAQLATAALLLLVCAAAAFTIWRIINSPFGRVIQAIRDNEDALKALGKDPARFKIQVLMLSAALAGIAGAFYAHYITFIIPEQFVPLVTFYVWMAIIIGGVGRISGAIVGTVLLMTFLEGSRFMRDFIPGVSEVEMASLRIGVIGLLLVLFTLYRPQGLMGDYTKR
ncbi:branched-chain amino acid ABC transporter permease [Chelativorans xinjiangense]|uniref:branched-chain amino acid ABC transporter permease n=1 Tax=Chelativorans xinjiangense TaxID=2681485 RepID=UPI00135CD566|nr:branched-chain amino acid ABC transporter permease [Chelativorans xinjiangense]